MSLDQYSETPASNYISGYFMTGMAPSSVKVAGSDIMADLASRFAAMHTATGTANAQIVTQTRQWASLVKGLELIFLPFAANTGATTLAVDGLTAKNIFYNGTVLVGGELSTTVPALVKYDGTQFNLVTAANTAISAQNNKFTYAADTGTVNVLAIAPTPAITAYADGQLFLVKVANTTTAAATLNVNALGTKNLYYPDGTTQLLAGSLILNNTYAVIYDSSLNSSAGGFIVPSPSIIAGSFTATLATGCTTTPTGSISYYIDNTGKGIQVINVAGSLTGTSNATGMTFTGIAAICQSAQNKDVGGVLWEDNGGFTFGNVTGTNSGTFTAGLGNALSGAFTSSGTKGWPAGSQIIYRL